MPLPCSPCSYGKPEVPLDCFIIADSPAQPALHLMYSAVMDRARPNPPLMDGGSMCLHPIAGVHDSQTFDLRQWSVIECLKISQQCSLPLQASRVCVCVHILYHGLYGTNTTQKSSQYILCESPSKTHRTVKGPLFHIHPEACRPQTKDILT